MELEKFNEMIAWAIIELEAGNVDHALIALACIQNIVQKKPALFS